MIWLGTYVVVIAISGYALTALFHEPRKRIRLVELMGMCAIFGCGAVPMILLFVSMSGFKPTRIIIASIGLAGAGVIGYLGRIGNLPPIARPIIPRLSIRTSALLGLTGLLILIQLACVIGVAVKLPILDIDGWAIWGTKAKVLHFQPLRPVPDYFHDLSLSYSHLDYPLLVPMLWAGGMTAIGDVDHPASKAVMLMPLVGTILLLYAAAREHLPAGHAGLLTALFAGAPAVSRWSGQGLADMALASFILAAAIWFMRWLREGRPRQAMAAGLLVGFALCTKLEGIVLLVSIFTLAISIALWSLIRGHRTYLRVIGAVILICATLLISGPWLLWRRDLPHTHEDYGSRITFSAVLDGFHRLPQLIDLLIEQVQGMSWIPLIAVALAMAVVGGRGWGRTDVRAGWFILIAQLTAYLVAYLVTPWDLQVLVPISAPRLILHVAPLAMLLTAMHWRAARGEPSP